jgi:RecA/RadA recombinase
MVNLVGDTSSGKTLLAIEACANFSRLYGAENARYIESEAAFDDAWAAKLGMPPGIQRCDEIRTVEDLHDDLSGYMRDLKGNPGLYVLDSVDALSSLAEVRRQITDKSTYAAEKAKVLHEIFRRRVKDIGLAQCCLMLISQTKDNVGNTFVPKTRSGGHALDFFASQIVWLHEVGKENRTVSGVERTVGINVRALNKKNKVGEPFRPVDFLIVFSYGVDDELSMIKWLAKHKADDSKMQHRLAQPNAASPYEMAVRRAREKHDIERLSAYASELRAATRCRWLEIEDALRAPLPKYGVVS